MLKPFCDLLAAKDDKTVGVVLDGVTNILATAEKLGETDKVAMMVEECGGLDRIEALQSHENEQIYHKALQIIETFFPDGEQVILNIEISLHSLRLLLLNSERSLFVLIVFRWMRRLHPKLGRQDSSSVRVLMPTFLSRASTFRQYSNFQLMMYDV